MIAKHRERPFAFVSFTTFHAHILFYHLIRSVMKYAYLTLTRNSVIFSIKDKLFFYSFVVGSLYPVEGCKNGLKMESGLSVNHAVYGAMELKN